MTEFRLLLESSIDINEDLVIVGDFNIHVEDPSNYKGTTFNQLLEDMGWIQLVNGRTHKAGHTLDLVIVRSGSSFVTDVEVSTLVSDHHLVECSVGLSRPTRERKGISFRNYGQTPAMAAGFNYATGRVIITLDGDLQNDPNDIPLLFI